MPTVADPSSMTFGPEFVKSQGGSQFNQFTFIRYERNPPVNNWLGKVYVIIPISEEQ